MDGFECQCRIAAVDDDAAILDAVCLVLETQGWIVRAYPNGSAFLADLNNYKPECLILDPQVAGLSAAAVARAVAHGNRSMPIIGLTARPVSAQTLELINAGVRVMLTKPVTAEVLINHVQRAMDKT